MYKNFVEKLPKNEKVSYVTSIFNTDGAEPSDNFNFSLWPIYLQINELPVPARFRKIVTCTLWFCENKPKFSIYLKRFVNLMNQKLSKSGIDCEINGKLRKIKIYILACITNTIRRAPCQGFLQYNGKFSCAWCKHHILHPTKSVKKNSKKKVTKYLIIN